MSKTKIEWAEEVWNPVTGCSPVSEGCRNCYARRMARRFWGERDFGEVWCYSERLEMPLHWRRPRRVFVVSMGDLFHPHVPDCFVDEVWDNMHLSYWHKAFIILTKRPQRMKNYLESRGYARPGGTISLPNVWLGVSVSTQEDADKNIPIILQTPAAVRLVSLEPMLEPIILNEWWLTDFPSAEGLKWVICGCESGPGARPMDMYWARSLRDQCLDKGIPFFLKQARDERGRLMKMPELDGKVWAEFPGDLLTD